MEIVFDDRLGAEGGAAAGGRIDEHESPLGWVHTGQRATGWAVRRKVSRGWRQEGELVPAVGLEPTA